MKISEQLRQARPDTDTFKRSVSRLALQVASLQDWAKKMDSLTPQKRTQAIRKIKNALPDTKKLIDEIADSLG